MSLLNALWLSGRSRYKSSNPLGNDIVNLFCNAGMFEAVMPSASTVTGQASSTVNSVAAMPPASTPAVGNVSTPAPTAALANSAASQNANIDTKDQSSSHTRDRDRHRDRSRSRERSRRDRSRSRDRHRDRDRSRSRDRDRRRGRDRSRERGRDRSRSRGRDRDRSRSRERSRSRGHDRSHGRYPDRSSSRDRDRRRSRDRSRSRDRERRDDGRRKSRWDTMDSSRGEGPREASTPQVPIDGNPQQLSAPVSAGGVPSLLNAGRMGSVEQPAVAPLMSSGVNNPSTSNVPGMLGGVDRGRGLTVGGGQGPGSLMAPGMANPAGMVGPNDASKVANQNVGPNMQRFPGNPTNTVQGDFWENPGSNFGASNMPDNNVPFSDMAGAQRGPRFGGPDAGGPYQTGNVNDNMGGHFRGPSMMNETGGNSGSGSMNNNMNNFMRSQGVTGRYPPPGNVDSMQGFRNPGGTVGSDNFTGMERSGPGMPERMNNMPQSSGGGMRMPTNAEGPRGFTPGRGFPGPDNRNSMQGPGYRMTFGNNSRMPTSNNRNEVGEPRMLGDSTGPFQRPPYDDGGRFGNMTRMQGGDMQSGSKGGGGGDFTNMAGGRMMNNQPESSMLREKTPNFGKPGSVRPLLDDPFYGQSAGPRPSSQVPPALMTQSGNQGNTSSVLPPPPPPPPLQDNKNLVSSVTPQTFSPIPVGVPAPPPSQGAVTDQQTAEQMQAAMAYYYAQWMQQQQQQPPPPPPPPPK